jgi:superfamily I DNA/RNA helicase
LHTPFGREAFELAGMKKLTDEQQAILAAEGDLKINAVAGSGKTSTLVAYAEARQASRKTLYLAFNRTVKEEAQQRFAQAGMHDLRIETAHSLAYKDVVRSRSLQLTFGYKPYELAQQLGIKSKDPEIKYLLATHTQRYLQRYLNSGAKTHTEINYAGSLLDEKAKSFADRFAQDLLGYTTKALKMMEEGSLPCLHDYYLKLFQLKAPKLRYDYILFDEGQDASGVMLDVLMKQNARKIIVGDVHQQIYSWRQAVNSLQQLPFPSYTLSASFRFSEEIAAFARKILAWKQLLPMPTPTVAIRGVGPDNGHISARATLARSNLFLLDSAIQQLHAQPMERIWFEGNLSAYTFASDGTSIFDVLSLFAGKPDRVKDPLLKALGNFSKLEEYLEKAEDPELAMITEMVRKYGEELPGYISALKKLQVAADQREQADMIFSTVHRSKGLEYDEVYLTSDFISEDKILRAVSEHDAHKLARLNEEINLFYVALTRARFKLHVPLSLWPSGPINPLLPDPTQVLSARRRKAHLYPQSTKRQWEWGFGASTLQEPDDPFELEALEQSLRYEEDNLPP